MANLLIRNIDEDVVRRIESDAERQGLSREEYLRRELDRLSTRSHRPVTRADFVESMEVFIDVTDDSVMEQAWR